MTTANTAMASNVFAGTLLNGHHYAVLNKITAKVLWPEACELLEYAT